jgi:hypothetical protein
MLDPAAQQVRPLREGQKKVEAANLRGKAVIGVPVPLDPGLGGE